VALLFLWRCRCDVPSCVLAGVFAPSPAMDVCGAAVQHKVVGVLSKRGVEHKADAFAEVRRRFDGSMSAITTNTSTSESMLSSIRVWGRVCTASTRSAVLCAPFSLCHHSVVTQLALGCRIVSPAAGAARCPRRSPVRRRVGACASGGAAESVCRRRQVRRDIQQPDGECFPQQHLPQHLPPPAPPSPRPSKLCYRRCRRCS
jgi:hypothetical protein